MSRLSPYWLWGLLTLAPALWTWEALTSSNARVLHILVHPTGEWAARLLIFTLMITPLAQIFHGTSGARWLRKSRRYFGVAAFGYAALHTLFYVLDKGALSPVLSELPRLYIWTGWLAFLIFVPLAVTSSDWFMRALGRHWKTLQRFTYLSAVLTLVHWAALHNWGHPMGALVQFSSLVALEAWRIWSWAARRRARRVAA